jgi:hypothetical protein
VSRIATATQRARRTFAGEMNAEVTDLAIQEIERELGRAVQMDRGSLTVVEIDPSGNGVILVRLARADRASSLTGQTLWMLNTAASFGLKPKLIVACANVDGLLPFEKRPDLLATLDALDEDCCTWVGMHHVDRIAAIRRSPRVSSKSSQAGGHTCSSGSCGG